MQLFILDHQSICSVHLKFYLFRLKLIFFLNLHLQILGITKTNGQFKNNFWLTIKLRHLGCKVFYAFSCGHNISHLTKYLSIQPPLPLMPPVIVATATNHDYFDLSFYFFLLYMFLENKKILKNIFLIIFS